MKKQDTIAKHAKVDIIWVAGRSPALVPQHLEATTLPYLAIVQPIVWIMVTMQEVAYGHKVFFHCATSSVLPI